MFKDYQRNFMKFFTLEKTILLLVVILLIWGISSYSYSKYSSIDNMISNGNTYPATSSVQGPMQQPQQSSIGGYDLQPVANPSDLLPVDNNSAWGNPNFMTQGNIVMPDLLQAGYHIGLDTIGQTLRNANYQERSDPIIQKKDVGPWQQSTIEPDLGRIPLEVGYGIK